MKTFPRRTCAALGLALALAGCRSDTRSTLAPEALPEGACGKLVVKAPGQSQGSSGPFSAVKVEDLEVQLLLPGHTGAGANPLAGLHQATVRLLTPRGHLYQELAGPFLGDDNAEETETSMDGYPYPVKAHILRKVGPLRALSLPFAVGGTAIVSNGLYGHWTATASLDGHALACVPAATFELTP